jgi:hypothetical protein
MIRTPQEGFREAQEMAAQVIRDEAERVRLGAVAHGPEWLAEQIMNLQSSSEPHPEKCKHCGRWHHESAACS